MKKTLAFVLLAYLALPIVFFADQQTWRFIGRGTVEIVTEGPLPSNLTNFSPGNGEVDVPTNTPFGCTATDTISFTFYLDTVNPPVESYSSTTCAFGPFSLLTSTVYYFRYTAHNSVGDLIGEVGSFTTQTPESEDLNNDRYLSAGKTTRGLVLPKGAATGNCLQLGSETTQTDVKTRWSDKSIRFAILSAEIPEDGFYPTTVQSASCSGTFTPVVPSASAVFTVYPMPVGTPSTTHTATAPAGLSSDCWLNGPLVRECRDVLDLDNSPVPPESLMDVYLDRRVWYDEQGIVDFAVNNMKRSSSASPVIYAVELFVNGVSVYTRGDAPSTVEDCTVTGASTVLNFSCTHGIVPGDYFIATDGSFANRRSRTMTVPLTTRITTLSGIGAMNTNTWARAELNHSHRARWRKKFFVGGYTEAQIEPDFTSLYAAKAIPTYLALENAAPPVMSGASTRSWFAAGATEEYAYDILGVGPWCPIIGNAGGRDELNYQPGYYAIYMVNKTQAQREFVLKMGDLAGSWPHHIVHESDGTMVDLDDIPAMAWNPSNTPIWNLAGGTTNNWGGGYVTKDGPSHHPAAAYLPYLLTGDRYYADEMKHWANYAVSSFLSGRDFGTGNYGLGIFLGGEPRMNAWGLKDIAHAGNYLPDDDPHREYFRTRVQNNLTAFDTFAATEDAKDPDLHGLYIGWRQDIGLEHVISLWQNGFIAFAIQHVLRQDDDYTGGTVLRDMIVDYQIDLLTNEDWNPLQSVIYNFPGRRPKSDGGTVFTSRAEQYAYWFLGDPPRLNPSSGAHLITQTGGMAPEIRLALLVGLATGRPNATEAYNYVMDVPWVAPSLVAKYSTSAPSSSKGPALGIATLND